MLRVLVVDDSPTARELIVGILENDPEIQIAGCADHMNKGVLKYSNIHVSVASFVQTDDIGRA